MSPMRGESQRELLQGRFLGADRPLLAAAWQAAPAIAALCGLDRLADAVTLAREGGTFCLPLAGVIDVEEERARLAKALASFAAYRRPSSLAAA